MLPFILFVLSIGLVNGKESFCDFNKKYCNGRNHVLCVNEVTFLNGSEPASRKPSVPVNAAHHTKELNLPNVHPNSIELAKKMMGAPTSKEECESACYATDTIVPLKVECNTNKENCNGCVCVQLEGGFNCITFKEITMIDFVDDILILEDYHLILLYVLIMGVFILNISVWSMIKMLSRYY